MNIKAMSFFLSEDNIKEHLEHLRYLRMKYSILLKSIPEIQGKDIGSLLRTAIDRKAREEAIELLWQIKSHELFFNSFAENPTWGEDVRKYNTSRERFLYDILMEVKDKSFGYLYVYKDKQKRLLTDYSDRFDGAFAKYEPLLCIDLYEHTYFLDYRFKKEKFLRNALAYFNTGGL